jgi:hypothetical protein
MVSFCANPHCGKPLHYLREGRIFIFDVADAAPGASGKRVHHLEHYWLCGVCSQAFTVRQEPTGIRLLPRPAASTTAAESFTSALAS